MSEWHILATIGAVGCVSYAMRAGGFLAAGWLPQQGTLPRMLRLAPGNLFVAFAAAGIFAGRWPALFGSLAAIGTMVLTKREWAALAAGFGVIALWG